METLGISPKFSTLRVRLAKSGDSIPTLALPGAPRMRRTEARELAISLDTRSFSSITCTSIGACRPRGSRRLKFKTVSARGSHFAANREAIGTYRKDGAEQ